MASPDATDSDEEGDYDSLLKYLPWIGDRTPSRTRSRSVRNSYADLQQLKTTTEPPARTSLSGESTVLIPSPNGVSDLHHRPRDRKSSLSDGVDVQRIGAMDRVEPFREATNEINREYDLIKHRVNSEDKK